MRSACVMMLVAGSAMATVDRSSYVIYGADAVTGVPVSVERRGEPLFTDGTAYSNMNPGPDGFVALPAGPGDANGVIGVDDYDSIADDDINVGSFRFVGGVAEVDGVMFFDFFDAAGALVNGFGVRLSQAGDFIWTINLATPVIVADAGLLQASVDAAGQFGVATTGRWFAGNAGATIGSSDPLVGGLSGGPFGPFFDHAFEINAIPTPGAVALAGFAGLAGLRRRR